MPRSPKQYRKRAKYNSPKGNAFSRSLRVARDLIAEGKRDQGLLALNQLATAVQQPVRRGRIALLIGESEASCSRYNEAATAYARAATFGRQSGNSDLILAGSLGQVRALLGGLRTDEAKAAATTLLADLDAAQQALQKVLDLTPQVLAAQGPVQVPSRPPRPTVGLTKIATAFHEAGLTGEAKIFLEKAIVLSPNGASRARQLLAKIALASDDPARAESLSREALQMGRFQVKTIAAWPLYLDARARQGLSPILDPLLYQAFVANTAGRVRSSSMLSIIRVLRGHGDPAWKALTEQFLETSRGLDPVTAMEIEKILHADAKLTSSDSKITLAARSLRLFRDAKASPNEQIANAKSYVRYSLESGSQPDVNGLKRIALARFSPTQVVAVRHAVALAAMDAQQYNIARSWLLQLIGDLQVGEPSWGRAKWALARMEALLDNHFQAATHYFEIAQNALVHSRFRVQAMLRGLGHLTKSGNSSPDITNITSSIQAILDATSDYTIVLDAARQLALSDRSFEGLKKAATKRGSTLADQAIAATSVPREALGILEFLARRQLWDLRDTLGLLSRWDALTEQRKKEFRTAGGSVWYSYLALVFRALVARNRLPEATQLASSVIDGDQATPEGYVIVGGEYAVWLLKQGQAVHAFEHFSWIATEAPTHRSAATAHYWIAIRYLNEGNGQAAKNSAMSVRKCFGGSPSLLSEWELDAKAICILGDLSEANAKILARGAFTDEFISRRLAGVTSDRQSI